MITKYYKREYYDGDKGKFVTKLSTDMGKLIAANEVWGVPRKDGITQGPPVTEISKSEYDILKRGWGDDSIARAVGWFDYSKAGLGNDNNGYLHGIEYLNGKAGEEDTEAEWFQTETMRDAVLKKYFEQLAEEEEE